MLKGSLINEIKRQIEKKELFKRREGVLIACSGGADSVVMTEILRTLAPAYSWRLVVCHVNHHIRGREAQEDALWVGNFCRVRGLEYCIENVDAPKYAAENSCSLEEAARIVRYRALNKVAEEKNMSAIAVAHNMEDNAETVLMNILRGSGMSGLTGIGEKLGCIVRPLLHISRQEIEDFARVHKLTYRTDSSNKNKKYLRNKVRLELFPSLKKYNPEIITGLCKMAGLLKKDAAFLDKLAYSEFLKAMERKPDGLQFSLTKMKELDDAILSRVLLFAVKSILADVNGSYISNRHIVKTVELVREGKTGATLELPGNLKIKKDYKDLLFSLLPFAQKEKPKLVEQVLPIPGRIILSDGRILRASLFRGTKPSIFSANKAVFPAHVAKGSLSVRGRANGDLFCPSGMRGQKQKLKDFFINNKIPAEQRDSIPLVFDQEGLLWVAGLRCAHRVSEVFVDSWLYLELIDKEYINV